MGIVLTGIVSKRPGVKKQQEIKGNSRIIFLTGNSSNLPRGGFIFIHWRNLIPGLIPKAPPFQESDRFNIPELPDYL
jgi:hypothetical protein